MTAIRLENFAGLMPRLSDRLLPPNAATVALNLKLTNGELRGLHEMKVVTDFSALGATIRRAFRIPDSLTAPAPMSINDHWAAFEDADTDFCRTPLVNDTYERYYWTGDSGTLGGVPSYNTRARIIAADPALRLGVPTPVAAPTVAPAAGSDKTRAYVYTLVSAYGEEGPPSSPTLATGGNGTWNLSAMDTTVPDAAERNITEKKIYRTVPGQSSSEFFYVATIPLATATYADSSGDATVAANPLLESTTFTEPPAALQGLTVHPNGFMVGFTGRDLWFSEPYRPHAWPVAYVLSTETEIVGIAVYNGAVIVTTNSRPYIAEGIHPASIALHKVDSIDPCVSRRSMVTTLEGVFYASPQGIVLLRPGLVTLATSRVLTRDEWNTRFNPAGIKAAPFGLQYVAFDRSDSGFIFSPAEPQSLLSQMDQFNSVEAVQVDQYTGEIYIIRSNQAVLWDPVDTVPLSYTWQSKVFELPEPVNFGALQVKFRNVQLELGDDAAVQYAAFNTARIANPLNCVNLAVVNGVRTQSVSGFTLPQNKNPVGGSPLYQLDALLSIIPAVQIRIWARNKESEMELVYSQTVDSEAIYRLPTGYKSDIYQVELISNTDVYSVAIAETAKELKRT